MRVLSHFRPGCRGFLHGLAVLLLGSTLLLPMQANAAMLAPGAAFPALTIDDQHGKPLRIDGETQLVIFTADMAAGDFVKEVLRAQAPGTLEQLHAIYLSDISGMPSLITRMVALPKLRELPFAVGLGRDAAQLADLPRQSGAASVVQLQGGKVTAIGYVRDAAQLRQALGLR
ncbi:hypothetical protein HCX48_06260 [Rhodocyclus tenuis]|uniref:Uncharacterized protein n=1 Tax=Rhodocyclus gracilis TaxID=2929842 RepID=A0ABX0WH08_9RHOO|nr:hypothetical protein [Rhodocyclus gracilis]NJA88824.1 hypothetical protein [Rhodocyclus gracilis]